MTQDATEILEPFRKYLKVLAELHLDRKLRGKLDPSDVVQQTMLRAYSALAEVRDGRPEVLVAWLRRILARTLADAVKHYERDKRHRDGAIPGGRSRPFRVGFRRMAGRRPHLTQRPGRTERGAAAHV
jgi:DNA-directed RNA polymerase specialized sigma24 family protein